MTRPPSRNPLKRRAPGIVSLLAIFCLAGAPAHAGDVEGYLIGEMAKLELLEEPVSLADHQITHADGSSRALGDKRGKVLLVNLWSKGCLPCRAEMKDFSSLQAALGGDRFEVVALPMEKRSVGSARKILSKWGAENLEPYGNDPQALAQLLFDGGLFTERTISFVYPTTYVVNQRGEILAVREGFLHWDVPETRALISALMDEDPEG